VTHREYLYDVVSAIAFTASTTEINPGHLTSFPWLSRIANNYESYVFRSLKYLYEPQCSTATAGTIMLAVDFNARDPAPVTKTQVMAYEGAIRSPAWSSCSYDSPAADLHKRKTYYTRRGTVTSGAQLDYDTGNFFLCVMGQAVAGSALGELYVEYTVDLFTPQINDVGAGLAAYRTWSGTSNAAPFVAAGGTLATSTTHAGTTSSVTTVKFNQEFTGLVSCWVEGTSLGVPVFTGTCEQTAIVLEQDVATDLTFMFMRSIRANIGETWIITIPNATIVDTRMAITQTDYPLSFA
jgi:hypothetical protein